MPRRNIRFVTGSYYHIYNRGAGRLPIVREERNYAYLLRLMQQVASECRVTIIVYCLLSNHYHWLVRQDGNTSAGMVPKRVFGSYSQAFNKAYQRSGTLFEGAFRATLVDTDAYLRHMCRYIHCNPVKHGFVSSPELWPYSNYLEWIERRPGTLLDRRFVQEHFATPEQYEAFVREYLSVRASLPQELLRLEEGLEA